MNEWRFNGKNPQDKKGLNRPLTLALTRSHTYTHIETHTIKYIQKDKPVTGGYVRVGPYVK